MPQAGTYEELLKAESVVGKINKLFDGQIKAACPDKSLFELAEKFLSFVGIGGASRSKSYAENPDELRMLIAHCEKNGIAINEKAISEHLRELAQHILDRAGISIDKS